MRFELLLVIAILFLGASTLCLPVPISEEVAALYPWWAKRLFIGNILVHELLFLFWLLWYGIRNIPSLLACGTPMLCVVVSLILLGLWCGLISLQAPLVWKDLGRTLRIFLNAAFVLAVVRWGRQFGILPLATIVTGFLAGTLVNLTISFQYPVIIAGVMRLSGQNTPGVAAGIAIHLSAWWFYLADRLRTKLLIVCAALVFTFTCAISFSRIGWFAGATGLLAWFYIVYFVSPRKAIQRKNAKWLRGGLTLLFFAMLVLVPTTNIGQASIDWMLNLVTQKVSRDGEGDRQRLAYLYGTIEIIEDNPLGVGYSGFFDAMKKTSIYRSPDSALEESRASANPHSTFLWYTTAGGVPGLMLAIFVFISLLGRLRCGLRMVLRGHSFIPFSLIASAYLLMGLTVPYLFSNFILIFPSAYMLGLGCSNRERKH